MAAFMMKLHLEKDAQTFTMGAERLENARNESESAAALDAYLAEHTVLREISGEETDGIANNLYIADNLWTPAIDADLTVGFLVPRRIFLVSEDDAGCELLAWMADGEDWLPASVNYAAYCGKFFERVDTTEAMVYAMLEVYDHPGDDRYDIERHTLQRLENRCKDVDIWRITRKKELRAEFFLTEKNTGRRLVFHSPAAMEKALEKMLKTVLSKETEALAHDTEFSLSCNFNKRLKGVLRVFEGSEEAWRQWEEDAAAPQNEYTDADFQKILEGNRGEVKGENLYEKYLWDFRSVNHQKRNDLFEEMSQTYDDHLTSHAKGKKMRWEKEAAMWRLPDQPEKIRGMMLGFAVGDALGVPVEFSSREERDADPVAEMRSGGCWKQPAGTWSDDTSLTLATMESIARLGGFIDYTDIMNNFLRWYREGAFTATGEVFDVGNATEKAIERFNLECLEICSGTSPVECGSDDERDNGNGALMRILPIAAYQSYKEGNFCCNNRAALVFHNASRLTHAHPRSQVACGIYSMIASELLHGASSLQEGIGLGLRQALIYYCDVLQPPNYCRSTRFPSLRQEAKETYRRLWRQFMTGMLPTREEIRSTPYVVDTLEAALWCLLTTTSYREAVLAAVNLGGDTDTVAAVTGGLAGIFYGPDAIPEEWLTVLKKRDEIEELCRKFCCIYGKLETDWHRLHGVDLPNTGSHVWIHIGLDAEGYVDPDEYYSEDTLPAVFDGERFVCDNDPYEIEEYRISQVLSWRYASRQEEDEKDEN